MNLLKIGQTYINLDQVACIRDLATTNSSGGPVDGPIQVEFAGGHVAHFAQQADSLRSWLGSNVTASVASTPDVIPGPIARVRRRLGRPPALTHSRSFKEAQPGGSSASSINIFGMSSLMANRGPHRVQIRVSPSRRSGAFPIGQTSRASSSSLTIDGIPSAGGVRPRVLTGSTAAPEPTL